MNTLAEHVTHQQPAVYPPIARAAHVTGDVVVGLEIDETGKLTQAVVLSGPEMLRANALDALKLWTFRPVEIAGKPNAVRSAVVFKFKNYLDTRSNEGALPR